MSDTKSTAFRFIKPLVNVALEDSSASHLLMFLCLAANSSTGESFHSQASMKSRLGLEAKTVRRATKKLESLGLITCKPQGRYRRLLYTVNHGKLVELAEAGKQLCAERRTLARVVVPKGPTAVEQKAPTAVGQKAPTAVGQKAPTNLVIEPVILTSHKELEKPSFEKQNLLVSFQELVTNHDKVNPTPTPKEECRLPKVDLTPKQKGLITQIKQIEEQRSKAKNDPWEYVRLEK